MKEGQEILKINQMGEVVYLTFPVLENQKWLTHCFSTRLGGVSEGIYASMNFREDADDKEEHVRENYRRIARVLNQDVNYFVRSRLIHGTKIHLVQPEDYGEGVIKPTHLEGYDGLMTNQPGVTLVATFADCVPLYFADPVNRAIALSHSGWRGTVAKIGEKTVQAMKETFQTKEEDLIVCIGPCICQECYEVGKDVADEVKKMFLDSVHAKKNEWMEEVIKQKKDETYQLDLRKVNEAVLLEAGILKEHIVTADLCTCCNRQYLFSHRATKGKRGNMAAFLSIV